MQPDRSDQTRQRMQQAKLLSREVRGERLNLGKKISVPVDLMMEELNLPSNRGSRMFQERQRRVERFTLENNVNNNNVNNNDNDNVNNVNNGYDYSMFPELDRSAQNLPDPQPENQENQTFHPVPGKYSLVTSLQKTVAKKGSPDVIAPGYSGPLKEIPHEKFNTTIIPKSYCSPWREALGDQPSASAALASQLPELPHQLQPANYRCFNRAAMPFGGPMASRRVVPVSGLEVLERPRLPCVTLERLTQRPNFNRAPRGWGHQYAPESSNL